MWEFPKYNIDEKLDWSLFDEYDWFRDMKDTEQDPIWHGEGDVQTHTKMVCESLLTLPEFKKLSEQDKHIMFTACLMHDIEKRSTTTTQTLDGKVRIVAPSHARKGEYTTRKLLYTQFNCPFHIREQICKIVRYHGIPLWGIKDEDVNKRIIKTSLIVKNEFLYMISKADVLGRICPDKDNLLESAEFFKLLCQEEDVFTQPKEFYNSVSQYKFLNEGGYPDIELFDDKKFKVIITSALPGSGKDTFINKYYKDIPSLSLDDLRREDGVDPTDKKKNGQIIQKGKEMAKEFMRERQSFIFNATNITKDLRGKWINLFMEYGAKVKIIYIEVPYKDLLKQNSNREYKVPDDVMDKLISKLEIPSFEESHEIDFVV